MESLNQLVQNALFSRKENRLLRSLALPDSMIDFSSNDYLGLAKQGSKAEDYGSGGSRLLSCNSEIAAKSETAIAAFHNSPDALIFGSGYAANLGFISAFAMRDLTIIYDELCHASIRDGLRLGVAKSWKFKHNDCSDLEKKLKQAETPVLVITESVFSMDGDSPDFKALLSLKEKHKFSVLIDEAHASGWFEKGKTLTESLGIDEFFDARLVTFGKALGAHGAAVLSSSEWKLFLLNFARPFIYSTGPGSSFYHRINTQYHRIQHAEEERKSLLNNISHCLSRKQKSSLKMLNSESPIQGFIGNEKQVRAWEKMLHENGISAKKILSPTVPVGQERIRICLHSYNTKNEIELLFKLMENDQ